MWIKKDIHGNTVKWYESELIERIKSECSDKLTQNYDISGITQRVLDLINSYEKEDS